MDFDSDGLPVLCVPKSGPERREMLPILRRALLDNLEPMELRGASLREQAQFVADALRDWKGTKADHMNPERCAEVIEQAFLSVHESALLYSSPYDRVRVRLSRALRVIGAVPAKTSARRKAKFDCATQIFHMLEGLGDGSGDDALCETAEEIADLVFTRERRSYLVVDTREEVACIARILLDDFNAGSVTLQIACDIADALWTSDPNVDAREEPPSSVGPT